MSLEVCIILIQLIASLTPPSPEEMDMVERIIREATAKSKDGRIDQSDFLNHAASSARYSLFTPMEASIIFHFAGRGIAGQRLALLDFAQLLDPRWRPPHESLVDQKPHVASTSILHSVLHSSYNFVQGGESFFVGVIHSIVSLTFSRVCWCLWRNHRVSN